MLSHPSYFCPSPLPASSCLGNHNADPEPCSPSPVSVGFLFAGGKAAHGCENTGPIEPCHRRRRRPRFHPPPFLPLSWVCLQNLLLNRRKLPGPSASQPRPAPASSRNQAVSSKTVVSSGSRETNQTQSLAQSLQGARCCREHGGNRKTNSQKPRTPTQRLSCYPSGKAEGLKLAKSCTLRKTNPQNRGPKGAMLFTYLFKSLKDLW